MNDELINFLRERTAEGAAGTTALRNQGDKGVIQRARSFLKSLDLRAFSKCTTEVKFMVLLDESTVALQNFFPPAARNWGAARKVLNLYLRDVFYNRYLCDHFNFDHLESWLELPLDSFAAKGIQKDALKTQGFTYGQHTLERFPGIKYLTREVNEAYQQSAASIASTRGFARVHLDIIYWRDVGQEGKK